MGEAQATLLSTVVLDALVAMVVVGGFWAAIALMGLFGNKVSYSLAPLGFSRPEGGALGGIFLGMSVGAFSIALSFAVKPLSAYVLKRLGYSTESTLQQPFMQGLSAWVRESPGAAVPAIILVAVFFGPAVEELVFRGVVFNGLYRLGAWISKGPYDTKGAVQPPGKAVFALSALASSVLFALLHLEPVLVPVLVIFAVVLCSLFRRTGSLLPCFVAHATFNSFATAVIVLDGLGVLNVPI